MNLLASCSAISSSLDSVSGSLIGSITGGHCMYDCARIDTAFNVCTLSFTKYTKRTLRTLCQSVSFISSKLASPIDEAAVFGLSTVRGSHVSATCASADCKGKRSQQSSTHFAYLHRLSQEYLLNFCVIPRQFRLRNPIARRIQPGGAIAPSRRMADGQKVPYPWHTHTLSFRAVNNFSHGWAVVSASNAHL